MRTRHSHCHLDGTIREGYRQSAGERVAGLPHGRSRAAATLILLLAAVLGAACRAERVPPKTYTDVPLRGSQDLEVVAALGAVLGNVAVSPTGRIFITYHPEGSPAVKVAEISAGSTSRPYPDEAWQQRFQSPQGIKLDTKNRLWVLDHGKNGFGRPALYAFDIGNGALVDDFAFGSEHGVGWGSHLNDLSIDDEHDFIYIADTSSYRMSPGIIVYDIATQRARRVLAGDKSVEAEKIDTVVEERKLTLFGVAIRVAVDSIVLDLANEYLYYGPFSGTRMYRVPAAVLRDPNLSPAEVAQAVEDWGPKPVSDGITIDRDGNLYITAVEDHAVTVLRPPGKPATDVVDAGAPSDAAARATDTGRQATMVRDPRLIWPDGLSFGPDGWVYVTDSQLNRVLFHSRKAIAKLGPHYLYRFRGLAPGQPGR